MTKLIAETLGEKRGEDVAQPSLLWLEVAYQYHQSERLASSQ